VLEDVHQTQKASSKVLLKIGLFCLIFLPLTLFLGFWQLDRADYKAQMLADQQGRSALPAQVLSELSADELQNFRPVIISGQYEQESFLLDNKIYQGKVGYELLSRFSTEDGRQVLVNRGWLPAPKYRSEAPRLHGRPGEQPISLEGFFYVSDGEIPLLDEYTAESFAESPWPRRIPTLAWSELSLYLPQALSWQKEFRLANSEQPGAYRIDWKTAEVGPEKHLAYAWQWFAMSAALIILTAVASYKLVEQDEHAEK
jgi:surfeit locus 1 family protein